MPSVCVLFIADVCAILTTACARAKGRLAIANALLSARIAADPNIALAFDGRTPLYAAAYDGHLDVVEASETPHTLQCSLGPVHFWDCAELYLQNCISQTKVKNILETWLLRLVSACLPMQICPLACCLPHSTQTTTNTTPKYACVGYTIPKRTILLIRYQALLENKADPNAVTTDGVGASAIYIAAEKGHVAVVSMLLRFAANPNIRRADNGATPMLAAAQDGRVAVLKALLAPGGDAAEGGGASVKADPNIGGLHDDATPIYWAAYTGNVEVLDVLLNAGADPNIATTDTRETVLYVAAVNGFLDVATALLEAGANARQVESRRQQPPERSPQ